MPFAFLDKDLLDKNISSLLNRAGDKKIRIATKSVRCTWTLRYILDHHPRLQGLMCYSVREAAWLATEGFDDLLVAYPAFHSEDIREIVPMLKRGKRIYLMVDLEDHLRQVNQVGREENVRIPVCLDLDMTSKFPGVYFGVYRSSVNNKEKADMFFKTLKKYPFVHCRALMGYEAQIAGLGDNVKGKGAMNAIIRNLKKRSVKEVALRRKEVVALGQRQGVEFEVVNAGGTGSLETSRQESWVTEVTVGSGFYASHLFDHYKAFKHLPAAGYAIEVVRNPQPDIYTCLGGGYVASGTPGKDKTPIPYLPEGCSFIENEMAGEVQTPLKHKGGKLELGSPVFMRHSKAGELCEHFNELVIVSNGEVVDSVPTYRGEGQCFL